jgi:ABC-type transport system involved in multi-copper enzyme maturation permease subunit
MYRSFVILRHTFLEAVVQPIYSLLIALGAAILVIFSMLPFFTLGEDTVMFKAVGLDIILLLVLIATLFATSKSIYEEIEDRTMLTLMSKPVAKWEVLVGKYLGIIVAALLAIVILGAVFLACTWFRIPDDYLIRTRTIDDRELRRLLELRMQHLAGLGASLLLVWLQVSVLAAIGVALSTRFSLVVNLPAVILIYIAGNLTRFLPSEASPVVGIMWAASQVLPFLQVFDLREHLVYGIIKLHNTQYANVGTIEVGQVFAYLGLAVLYALMYSTFALAAGMLSFSRRELGGAEG